MLCTVITAHFPPLWLADALHCHHCPLPSPVAYRCFALSSLPTSIPCGLQILCTVITAHFPPLWLVNNLHCHHCPLPFPVSCKCFALSSLPTSLPCGLQILCTVITAHFHPCGLQMLCTVITAHFPPLWLTDALHCHHCPLPSPVACRYFALSSLPTSLPCGL
ncbi:hypothetical protein BgiBS90_036406 [Biomphalaria glabrata]|nr:hypothetical protein BgiBS90_036406 [Biomphalaria glabrata]